jgi:hypothetical protein
MSCLKTLSVAGGELETILKEAVVAYLRYYAGFNLEKHRRNTREIKDYSV